MYRDQWMKLLQEADEGKGLFTLRQAYGISILQRLMNINPDKETHSGQDRLSLRAIKSYAEDWSIEK